ncbi:SRPBCC family protein [Janthinobacterium agaricidamnosum]|uniref:Polyketide cyclase / dehydrase and lipid transport family protein n=1 Tax=Janthinobacterium agaricidamnosum NBRC 102515 = DSM 9628 TaxID=1349767 RepID=W0VCG3_9BURK|nr:SRPBCC family protein [Janthinobacterium agaricidamnosum]CDG85591.1 polyketide cyclase / dehydrase and lipid transport family protein [Janthinobacterium agaricidamnosum NBRC 102515 = DSM 9628]
MQNSTEQPSKNRSRHGSWQFPNAGGADGTDNGTLAEAESRRQARTRDGRAERRQDSGRKQDQQINQLSTMLGWLSIGIGLMQLLAPRRVARVTGLPASPLLLRVIGLREVACGIGLLNQRSSPAWNWSRVAGDAMDLTLLGVAAGGSGSARKRIAATAVMVAGVTALDVVASKQTGPQKLSTAQPPGLSGVSITKSITVNRSADECYQVWRDLENLPRFMPDLDTVRIIDQRRSHWKLRGPSGGMTEWDAEITDDQPGKRLAWRSLDSGAEDENGVLEFSPANGGKGTVVTMRLHAEPPAGKVGAALAKLFSTIPDMQIDRSLRRFKQWVETGEIATTEGQPAGMRSLKSRLFKKGARS